MSVAIIINPVSGGGTRDSARRHAELASTLLASCRESGEVFVTERRGHARELAAAAVARGCRLVVAWGGDGTVNEIGSVLAGRPTAIAIIPSGSGNGLARELGVAWNAAEALQHALVATPRAIDAGELGGRLFFSVAGVGFDAHVAECFDRDLSGRRGFATYARITLRELWKYQSGTYCIDGVERRGVLLATVANTRQFGNGVRIAPSARVDDGKLDLVVFEEVSRLRSMVGLRRLFTGGIARLKGVSMRTIEQATIECDRPMLFHVDGEPVHGGTRLEASIRSGALRVSVR